MTTRAPGLRPALSVVKLTQEKRGQRPDSYQSPKRNESIGWSVCRVLGVVYTLGVPKEGWRLPWTINHTEG